MSEAAGTTGHPGFGVMLARLLDHRGLSVQELASRAGLTASEVRAVLAGEAPGEGRLRRIAPAVGFHAVDLFILAGLAVPDDMAPLDAAAGRWAPDIVMDAVHLSSAERRELLQLIRSMPQEERPSLFTAKRLASHAGPGGWAIRMLQYRNLSWMGMAQLLAVVTPTYLSAATYGVIGNGRKELTPRLVTDFAALLGANARELAALTGIYLHEVPPPPAPEAVDAAVLLWEARRLSAGQAEHVAKLVRSMRGDSTREYILNLPGS
ncbi:helix-turn-helix transcriptional regulator [Streptomyces sp. NPDC006516]|uniref:helix-turn-helix transcriptional regulator n=1 Tax=Streptomyces sp. NPDC006516 TaxID=3154309 RepID=UPI0033A4D9B0